MIVIIDGATANCIDCPACRTGPDPFNRLFLDGRCPWDYTLALQHERWTLKLTGVATGLPAPVFICAGPDPRTGIRHDDIRYQEQAP